MFKLESIKHLFILKKFFTSSPRFPTSNVLRTYLLGTITELIRLSIAYFTHYEVLKTQFM